MTRWRFVALTSTCRPTLLLAATLQGLPPQEVVAGRQLLRVAQTHPLLFPTAEGGDGAEGEQMT